MDNTRDDPFGDPTEYKPLLPIWKLFILTVSFFGIQIGCEFLYHPHFLILTTAGALQIAFASPILQELGVPESYINLAWLAGPISGIISSVLFIITRSSQVGRSHRATDYWDSE